MIVLDENIPESQRALLRRKRVALRQIGVDLGGQGMKDDETIALLHNLNRPTFFTLDSDFYVVSILQLAFRGYNAGNYSCAGMGRGATPIMTVSDPGSGMNLPLSVFFVFSESSGAAPVAPFTWIISTPRRSTQTSG